MTNATKIISPSPQEKSKIIHPVFLECAQFTLDPFWQQIFEDCAHNKFPKGVSIDTTGKVLYFRTKTKNVVSYKLDETPEEIFTNLKKMFQEQLNIKSNKDREEIRAELDEICKYLQDSFAGSWQQIKRKKIKDPIIRRYILDLKGRYKLNDRETAKLAQLIKLGFLFNWIDNDNVIYQNQQIIDIDGLQFDDEERTFRLEEQANITHREYKPKSNKLITFWEKYLDQPKNRYNI